MYDFTQDSLRGSEVYILDAVHEVYVWIGPWCIEILKRLAMETAVVLCSSHIHCLCAMLLSDRVCFVLNVDEGVCQNSI